MDIRETDETTDKYLLAKKWLFNRLGKGGLIVKKHGRFGYPKTRKLQCDPNVSKLFCRSDAAYKDIVICDITSIRKGTDVDPNSPLDPMFSVGINDEVPSRKKFFSFRYKLSLLDQPNAKFGTSNLRRNCKDKDMPYCVSLVTPDRTFDIQFYDIEDTKKFHEHMDVLVSSNIAVMNTTESFGGGFSSTLSHEDNALPIERAIELNNLNEDDEPVSANEPTPLAHHEKEQPRPVEEEQGSSKVDEEPATEEQQVALTDNEEAI